MQTDEFLPLFDAFRRVFEPLLYKLQIGEVISSTERSETSAAWTNLCGVVKKPEVQADEEETTFPRCSVQFVTETKEYDCVLLYAPNGDAVYQALRDGLAKNNLRVAPTKAFHNDDHKEEHRYEHEKMIAKSRVAVLVLTDGALKNSFTLFGSDAAIRYGAKFIMVHDQESCRFPGSAQQPMFLRDHFSHKALTFLSQFANTTVEGIVKKLTKPETVSEDISSRVFLSHKRTTGQGIAGRLFEGFKNNYKVFLDSEADFDIHDLQLIVKHTNIFLFILSAGILDSVWCIKELEAAVMYGKRIIVVKDFQFQFPSSWPSHIDPKLKDVILDSTTVIYMAEFYNQCVEKLKELIGAPDQVIKSLEDALSKESLASLRGNELENGVLAIQTQPFIAPLNDVVLPDLHSLLVNYYYQVPLQKVKEFRLGSFCKEVDKGLGRMLDSLPNLENISLNQTDITDKGVEILIEKTSGRLVGFDLGFTAVTAPSLVKLIQAQKMLKHLGVAQSSLTNQDVVALEDKLRNLESLDICNTSIGDEGIISCVYNCRSLRHLNLRLVRNASTSVIERLLKANPELISVDLSQTLIQDSTIDVIISHCSKLEHINIGGAQISQASIQKLDNLRSLKSITTYNIKPENMTSTLNSDWIEAIGTTSFLSNDNFIKHWRTCTTAPASSCSLDDQHIFHMKNRASIRTATFFVPGQRPFKISGRFRFTDRNRWQESDNLVVSTRSDGIQKQETWYSPKGADVSFSGWQNWILIGGNKAPGVPTGLSPVNNWLPFEVEDDGHVLRLTVSNKTVGAVWGTNYLANYIMLFNRENTGNVMNWYHAEVTDLQVHVRPF